MHDLLSITLAQSSSHLYGFEGTTSLAIFVAGFTAMVLIAAMVLKIKLIHWLMAGMLMAACLTPAPKQDMTGWVETWLFPVQIRRAQLHLAFGVLLTLLVLSKGSFSAHRVSFQALFLVAIAFYQVVMRMVHADVSGAVETLGFALATLPCIALAAPQACSTREGCMQMIKAMMWVSVLWIAACCVQFIINPQQLISSGGRFWGMLGNSNQAGQMCGPMAAIALWLLVNDTSKRAKLLWLALIGANLLFVIWSGSRAGGLHFFIGVAGVFYARSGKAILLLPVAGLMLWGLYELSHALEIGQNLDRFTSGGPDTRSGVWVAQWELAMENPLIGSAGEGSGYSENSYLFGFALYGIGMFALLVSFMLASAWFCLRLMMNRRVLETDDRALLDLFVAFNAMYFLGAFFEGFMIARSNTLQSMLLMFAGIGVYMRDQITLAQHHHDESYDGEVQPSADDGSHDHYSADDHERGPIRA